MSSAASALPESPESTDDYEAPAAAEHRGDLDQQRVEALMARMSPQDKAGLLFHDMVVPGAEGRLAGEENFLGRPATARAVRDLRVNHFNLVGPVNDVAAHVRWYNALQEAALQTPLGIPVTLSTDPRHAFSSNPGTAAMAGVFSRWPESLGIAAVGDPDLARAQADVVRREYVAMGLRVALHPQVDLATEPRWARSGMTFGEDVDLTVQMLLAQLQGLQGSTFGATSVSAVVKHFPGGGAQVDGEDPHFAYGAEQAWPGGHFQTHLAPFRAAVAAGARQVMPYYGKPVGMPFEEVAFGFNRDVVTGLLREELGFEGIVLSDWGLLTDKSFMGEPMPARAWGVEHLDIPARLLKALDAGVDQFGGECEPALVVELLEQGLLTEERLDRSVRRLLSEKFALGLFDRPFLDLDEALEVVGHPDHVAAGRAAQRSAVVRLVEPAARSAADLTAQPAAGADQPAGSSTSEVSAHGCASPPARTVYAEGLADRAVARLGRKVTSPEDADVAVLRLQAPFESRPGKFEAMFHAGSLEFEAGELSRLLAVCRAAPTVVVLYLDRAAVIPELAEAAAALLVEFGADDDAVVDVLTGAATAEGRLPLDLPSSSAAVAASHPDTPQGTHDPLFRVGDGPAPRTVK
ncbi:glycoside hydrolase family 3 protein [Quadrisphaera sp. KR29]|uniref:glycoside hydrolase family 3 protein n=1 Tax=Quadrisphaera sp. KR29 TaxID=3461391 RepID=UPI004043BA84